jgi:micrococcal nuclease
MTISGGPDGTAHSARSRGHPRTTPELQRTPEVYGVVQCYGPEASAFAKRLLTGRRVRYAIGVEPHDRYGRTLVYLWLEDGRFVNELLVARGYARTLAIAPNTRYAARFRLRAAEARLAGRGLWSRQTCA